MKVWLVGICDVEMTNVQHVCLSEKTALKRWNEIRQSLLKKYLGRIEEFQDENYKFLPGEKSTEKIYERMIKNLSETDPNKLNNYPQDEPFISEMEAEE